MFNGPKTVVRCQEQWLYFTPKLASHIVAMPLGIVGHDPGCPWKVFRCRSCIRVQGFLASAFALPGTRHSWKPICTIWVWVKIKPPGDHTFWSMLPLTRVPFWVPIFDPQPYKVERVTGSLGTSVSHGLRVDPPKVCRGQQFCARCPVRAAMVPPSRTASIPHFSRCESACEHMLTRR